MFEQTFKNIDNAFREDDGCSTELDYAEQSSWILFLKWLDDYEKDRKNNSLNHVIIYGKEKSLECFLKCMSKFKENIEN